MPVIYVEEHVIALVSREEKATRNNQYIIQEKLWHHTHTNFNKSVFYLLQISIQDSSTWGKLTLTLKMKLLYFLKTIRLVLGATGK